MPIGLRPCVARLNRRPHICNDFEQRIAYQAYVEQIERQNWGAPYHQGEMDLPPKADVRINDTAAVMVADGAVVTLVQMRWSFPPARPGAGPLFNYRSEGRRFVHSRRCLVPASAFYEFTAPDDPKQKRKDKWRFSAVDGGWLAIAGLWRAAEGNHPATFTLLTCDAGPDIAPTHKRQVVLLEAPLWRSWLELTAPEAEILSPTPAGVLTVAKA